MFYELKQVRFGTFLGQMSVKIHVRVYYSVSLEKYVAQVAIKKHEYL